MSVDRKDERHIMLDLETLGTSSNSVIISIGAVAFYPYRLIDEGKSIYQAGASSVFFSAIDKQSCLDIRLLVDTETEVWWSKQPEEAKAQFKFTVIIHSALVRLESFIEPCDALWGNGSDFDNVILANAYKACGFEQPWSHRANRCYRTMKAMFPQVKTERTEIAHHALEDAKYQTRHLLNIFKEMQ